MHAVASAHDHVVSNTITERLEYFTSQPRVNFATGIITRVIYDASDAGIPAVEKDGAKG